MKRDKLEKKTSQETELDDVVKFKRGIEHKLYSNLMDQIEILFGYNVLDSKLEDNATIKSHIDQSTKLFKLALTTKREDLGLLPEDVEDIIKTVSSNVQNQIFLGG
jgi:hypothetical protein